DGGSFQSLEVYNNELYVGGAIIPNGFPSYLMISKWDNTSWDSVDTGLNANPRVLRAYNNELYAAGDFDFTGANQILGISRWNGLQWNTVGSG
ncbi:hypothetical protein NL529_28240, partial [Klebsiella pneumoniae]|nr:hypothetical protein [Klebsiella pneumoniae]